jgi:hypothetical protein
MILIKLNGIDIELQVRNEKFNCYVGTKDFFER